MLRPAKVLMGMFKDLDLDDVIDLDLEEHIPSRANFFAMWEAYHKLPQPCAMEAQRLKAWQSWDNVGEGGWSFRFNHIDGETHARCRPWEKATAQAHAEEPVLAPVPKDVANDALAALLNHSSEEVRSATLDVLLYSSHLVRDTPHLGVDLDDDDDEDEDDADADWVKVEEAVVITP